MTLRLSATCVNVFMFCSAHRPARLHSTTAVAALATWIWLWMNILIEACLLKARIQWTHFQRSQVNHRQESLKKFNDHELPAQKISGLARVSEFKNLHGCLYSQFVKDYRSATCRRAPQRDHGGLLYVIFDFRQRIYKHVLYVSLVISFVFFTCVFDHIQIEWFRIQ